MLYKVELSVNLVSSSELSSLDLDKLYLFLHITNASKQNSIKNNGDITNTTPGIFENTLLSYHDLNLS